MYRIEWRKEIPALVLLALLPVAFVLIYPWLPERIPIHWNLAGRIDAWATKSWLTAGGTSLMTEALYWFLLFLPFLDPKQDRYADFLGTYRTLRIAITVFSALITCLVLAAAFDPRLPIHQMILASLALLLIVIGNYLGKLRPNWFVGIRLPWTLENEDVWKRTHRLGGKLLVATGVVGLAAVWLPPLGMAVALFGSLGVSLAVVTIYAYWLYRKIVGKR